jgi:ZIP family zinc transporter
MFLGISLAISILIHDIPEGISIALPLKLGGLSNRKIVFYVFLSGVSTGVGALFGYLLGMASSTLISLSLSFAAGAMLYIVSGELIPESKQLYKGRFSSMGNILGIIIGLLNFIINQ